MAKTLDAAGVKRLIQEIKGANKNLNTPIPISTENTPESMVQNVKNIADYVEKAKAAGIANVNGMAVTCLIDGENSGVGYLYVTNTQVLICGILPYEDSSVSCITVIDGTYGEQSIVVEGHLGQVTSDMLVEGARRPIILTPDTTEVDEETYQKLLIDDVDVLFKDASDVLYYIYDINNKVSELEIRFVTTLGSIDTTDPSDYWFSVAYVRISKNAPHTVTTESTDHSLQDVLNDSGYLNKSVLTPVLKKINLRRGNNSAVIRQFEADWENLNGSLFGARFIGFPAGTLPVLFMKDDFNDCYIGYTDRDIDGAMVSTGPFKKITLCANDNYNLKVTDVTVTVQYIDLNATTTNLTSIGSVQQNTPHCFTYTKDSEIIKGVGQVWRRANYGYLDGISFDGKYRVHAEVQANGAATVTLTSIGAQKLLQPVLQEIDLRGTDAERKAKLDQFETDWKALTGASDLTGARFVGKLSDFHDGVTIIFTYNSTPDNENYQYNWNGIYIPSYNEDGNGDQIYAVHYVTINPLNGEISYVDQIANMATYNYSGNLRLTYGSSINGEDIYLGATYDDDTGEHIESLTFSNVRLGKVAAPKTSDEVTNKAYVDAIKNNASKSIEAITIKTRNTAEDKAANVAAIKAYVDNLKLLGVDTTKGYMIPVKLDNGYHGFIMGTGADGEHTGVIKRSTYSYGGGWIRIDNIGTFTLLQFLTVGNYDDITTTAKAIIPAINEVNALAKGYSTIFTPIELTTETAQNKTAIDARVAAFTAQGISLTNGCCIPVTYKGVYAGNISLINGDWYGLLVKNTNNPADNINIKLSADGTITEGNSAQ